MEDVGVSLPNDGKKKPPADGKELRIPLTTRRFENRRESFLHKIKGAGLRAALGAVLGQPFGCRGSSTTAALVAIVPLDQEQSAHSHTCGLRSGDTGAHEGSRPTLRAGAGCRVTQSSRLSLRLDNLIACRECGLSATEGGECVEVEQPASRGRGQGSSVGGGSSARGGGAQPASCVRVDLRASHS